MFEIIKNILAFVGLWFLTSLICVFLYVLLTERYARNLGGSPDDGDF
ncbi:MAG: hypothetical protein RLZZ408_243 [Verrucomicrobiota bacterium]|jgi:hypothetical protein